MRVRVHPLIASTWAELTSLAQDYIELEGAEIGTRTPPQEGVEILTLSNYIPTTNYFSSLNLRHIDCQIQYSVIKHGKISVYQGTEKTGTMLVECWPRPGYHGGAPESRPCGYLLSDTKASFLPWEMVSLYLAIYIHRWTLICDPPASTSQRFRACTPSSCSSGRQALDQ